MNTYANTVIDKLGGTAEVARLCNVSMPSVSGWRQNGIPDYRLMYLKVIRRKAFAELAKEQAGHPSTAPSP